MAMSSRRRWPPEREETLRSATAARSRSSTSSAARRCASCAGQAVGAALADQLVTAELAVPGTVALPDEADRPAYVALAR